MHTLFDYLTYTKGLTYVISGLFLVSFLLFWVFLTQREKD